ncbi:hypothetical protein PG994_000460 [Apiospora phragmitis]|uniref:Glycoside hydrolase family 92 protein n=1 Tax=Apiospora phragmitis TaxID=2905665 RepID=A0ABR1X6D6_9PEZI
MRTSGVVAASALVLNNAASAAQDLTNYVLPDARTINGGNTFPGVSLPFGIIKLGPDLYTGSDSYSGYQATGSFTGFSLLHESGTGGAPKYGRVADARGSGTTREMSATHRAGLYSYTFPEDSTSSNVVVDVSHVLPSFRGQGLGQSYLGGNISVIEDPQSGSLHYEGFGSYDNVSSPLGLFKQGRGRYSGYANPPLLQGWNRAPKWTVYFCGHFDNEATYKTFVGTKPLETELASYDDTLSVTSRVGVSFLSTNQACKNVNEEMPRDISLATLEENVKKAWNERILSKITTTDTTNNTNLQLLYTSLYHMNIIPTNKTGENPIWSSSEPYYDDTFTLWDLFRCTTSLFHIIEPVAYEEFIRSLVDIWRHDGFMPDGRSSFSNGVTQGGSNADNVLADAYVKGVRGAVDWEDAFKAMVTDAETGPPNNNNPRDRSASTKEGRGALPDWLEHGYITTKYKRSVSQAVEYSANDFGLYQVASGMEKADEASRYLNRSRNWRNQWNPDMKFQDFTGFLGPRNTDGTFKKQDPLSCGSCYWGDDYYQGLPIEYSFNAHHDIEHLVELCGGTDAFVARLEAMFTPGLNPSGEFKFSKMPFNPGNEPSFTTPFLFNYVGRQDLTVKYSRFNAKSYYQPTPGGLPGNSDAGAMESWVLWVMLGLYPMTGQTTFLVGSPWFSDLTIHLGGGKELHITTAGGSEDAYYVQSLKVSGNTWVKAWVTWDDVFANGGSMEYVLGSEPVNWATDPTHPSPAT